MFYSQCLLSRKGPLGTIWLAAHFHKKLRKDQVARTNISSSVDQILLDELPIVTYRILGYLLLGVVRIYSKKVEYLLHDCRDVVIKINDFVGSKKGDMHMKALCAPYFSITLPERFELDAFDLDVLEDLSGSNVISHGEILLKDGWRNEETDSYSVDKYHCAEDTAFFATCSTRVRDVHSPYLIDNDMVAHQLHNSSNREASMERLRNDVFFLEDRLDPMILDEAEEEPAFVSLFHEEHQTGEEQIKFLDTDISLAVVKEPQDPSLTRLFDEKQHTDPEQIKFQEMTLAVSMNDQVTAEDCPVPITSDSTPQARFLDASVSGKCQVTGDNTPVSITMDSTHESRLPDAPGGKCKVTAESCRGSISIEATPELKLPYVSGEATPEFIAVRTPATKERARLSRKRRCFFDDISVLPNQVLKQQIENSSDLVCKRKKVPRTAFHVWKASQISNLPESFMEPSILGTSSELRHLFCKKEERIPETVETQKVFESLNTLGSKAAHISAAQTVPAPSTPVVEVPKSSDVLGPPTVHISPNQTDIAPSTPVACSSLRLYEVPEISNSDRVVPENSSDSIQKELFSSEDKELDISLLTEDINSCEGDEEEMNGWSLRTRMVARYLHRYFLIEKKQRGKEQVNLSLPLKAKTRKRNARLFYEILVLRTGGYIDAKQDAAYGDILVSGTVKLKQFCETDAVYSN